MQKGKKRLFCLGKDEKIQGGIIQIQGREFDQVNRLLIAWRDTNDKTFANTLQYLVN